MSIGLQQRGGHVLALSGLALTACCLTLASVQAQPTPAAAQLAGFTRPGNPNDIEKNGVVVPAALDDEVKENGIGGTVYFMVLERKDDSDDVWGAKLAEFQKAFKTGVDFNGDSSPDLDTSAQYLYLYQIVNDRKTLTPIESTSIALKVEPKDITSWGFFSGIGFATMTGPQAKAKSEIRPVAATNMVKEGKPAFYQENAPPVLLPELFRLAQVPTRKGEVPGPKIAKGIVQIHWDALDPAINPDAAMLLSKSDFGGEPSFRVIWNKENLIPAEGRSTVFGFTCNLPPDFQSVVRIRGKKVEVKGDKVVPAKVAFIEADETLVQKADGKGPSPKPQNPATPAQPSSPPAFGNAGLNPPLPAALGAPGGGGFSGGGVGGAPGGAAGASSGGGAAGGSSGQQQQSKQQQQQQQQATGTPLITINNVNQNTDTNTNQNQNTNQNTNQQQQQQQQRQQQKQQQGQHQGQSHGHEVVPQPAALVLAAIGLPFLLLFRRRRMAATESASSAPSLPRV